MGPPTGILHSGLSSEVHVKRLSRFVLGVHTRLGPEVPEDHTPPSGDGQTPQSYTSSQTLVGTSADPDTGYRTSSKRKRDDSPLDPGRNIRSFVAGSDGDSLPHYLTVSPAAFLLFPHAEWEYRFPRAGSISCGRLRVPKTFWWSNGQQPGLYLGCALGVDPDTPVGPQSRDHPRSVSQSHRDERGSRSQCESYPPRDQARGWVCF